MSDINLYKLGKDTALVEVPCAHLPAARLKKLFDSHMPALLNAHQLEVKKLTVPRGIRHSSEGIGEDYRPVIVVFGSGTGDGTKIVTQAIELAHAVMDQKAKFAAQVAKTKNTNGKPLYASKIKWKQVRSICVDAGFSEQARIKAAQGQHVELFEYGYHSDDWSDQLLLKRVAYEIKAVETPTTGTPTKSERKFGIVIPSDDGRRRYGIPDNEHGERACRLIAVATKLDEEEIKVVWLPSFIAFKLLGKTWLSVLPMKGQVKLYFRLDPDKFKKEHKEGYIRDVRDVSINGSGDLEMIVKNDGHEKRAEELIEEAYNKIVAE